MSELDLSNRHPDYVAQLATWLQSWDFYRGGTHVLAPGRPVSRVSFLTQSDSGSGTEEESPRRQSRFTTISSDSYIHSHVRESFGNWSDRRARAVHYPIFRHLCDLYASATLRTDPSYDGNIDIEPWMSFHNNVDLRGTNFSAFIRQALTMGLVFGVEYAMTDMPRSDGTAASKEQQIARGERAYSYLVNPTALIDYQVDQHGQFDWIVLEENGSSQRIAGEEWKQPPTRYRKWTRTFWELYEAQPNGGQTLIAGDEHPVGEVPISAVYARRSPGDRTSTVADGMLADAVHVDKGIFNRMSLIDEQVYGQCFAQLFLPDDGSNQWHGVDVGVGVAVPYNSEHGQPLMLSPDASLLLAQWRMIGDQLQMLKEAHGVGRGKSEHSKEERSAAALSVESRNENNQVASLAESIEEFDQSIHRHAALWEGKNPNDAPKASYSRDVSIRSVGVQIQDAISLQALGVSPKAMLEIVAPLVVQTMNEQGATKSSIARAIAALGDSLEAPRPSTPEVNSLPEDKELPDGA